MSLFFNTSSSSQNLEPLDHSQNNHLALYEFHRDKALRNAATLLQRNIERTLIYSMCRLNLARNPDRRENQAFELELTISHWRCTWKLKGLREAMDKLKLWMKECRVRELKQQHHFWNQLKRRQYEACRQMLRKWKANCCPAARVSLLDRQHAVTILSNIFKAKLRLGLIKLRQPTQAAPTLLPQVIYSIFSGKIRGYKQGALRMMQSGDGEGESSEKDSPDIMANILKHTCFMARLKSKRNAGDKRKVDIRQWRLKALLQVMERRQKQAMRSWLRVWRQQVAYERLIIMRRVQRLEELKAKFVQSNS